MKLTWWILIGALVLVLNILALLGNLALHNTELVVVNIGMIGVVLVSLTAVVYSKWRRGR